MNAELRLKDGIAKQPRRHQIRLGHHQFLVCGLEVAIVQQRDLDGLVRRQLRLEQRADGIGYGGVSARALVPVHALARAIGHDAAHVTETCLAWDRGTPGDGGGDERGDRRKKSHRFHQCPPLPPWPCPEPLPPPAAPAGEPGPGPAAFGCSFISHLGHTPGALDVTSG